MSVFQKRFIKVVEAANDDATADREAMAATLDKGSAPEDFDVQAPQLSTKDVLKQSYDMQAAELQGWIS